MIQEFFLLSEGCTTSYASLYKQQLHLLMSNGSSNLLISYREQPRSTWVSFSRPHINTEVHDGGGLKLVQLAREPAPSCPKSCASPKRARYVLLAPCILVSRRGFIRHTPRSPAHLPFRRKSGACSRAPPVLVPSPLKTVWFVDSTGSTPPSTSGMLLTGHSTPGLLTVSSLPREAARAVRNTVPA